MFLIFQAEFQDGLTESKLKVEHLFILPYFYGKRINEFLGIKKRLKFKSQGRGI